MEWTATTIDRLHARYERYIDQLRADVIEINRSLGSPTPEKTGLKPLTRAEFESLLTRPSDDPEMTRLWIWRIIYGHEDEFPELAHVIGSRHDSRAVRTPTALCGG